MTNNNLSFNTPKPLTYEEIMEEYGDQLAVLKIWLRDKIISQTDYDYEVRELN